MYEYGVNWHTRTQTDFASFWNFIRNHLTGDEDNKYNIPEDLLKHYKVRASKVYADKHEKEPKAMSDNDIAKLVWVGGDDVPSITGTVEMQIRQAVMQHVLFGEEYAYDIDEVVADAVRYVFRRLSKVPGIYRNRVGKIKAVIEPKIARYSRNFEQKFRKEYEGKQPR